MPSLKVCSARAEAGSGVEVPSSLRSSQTGDQSLPWKQEAKHGHGEAHPDGQILPLVPHDLREDGQSKRRVTLLEGRRRARFITGLS